MKFFKPQVEIARELQFDAPPLYFAHVVTFCPRTRFRADGFEIDDTQLQEKGIYNITVKLLEDATLPEMEFITPVVHTLALGAIEFPEQEGVIRVTVQGAVVDPGTQLRNTNPTTTTKTGGSTSQNTVEASPRVRPIDDESLS